MTAAIHLAFCRWLQAEKIGLAAVTTDVLLRFLAACRQARVPGRPGPNVVSMTGRRLDQYAAATVNHRLIAVSGMFAFRSMRDPGVPDPVPKGREARRASSGQRNGMLAHVARRPAARPPLRLREPAAAPDGDSTTDIAEGNAAGLRTVQVRTGKYADQRAEGLTGHAEHEIDSVADLPAVVAELPHL